MLQQTQVAAVIPYYERFLRRFPTVGALAAASEEDVLELWSGLGYYARGRNLHAAARIIAREGFPGDSNSIERLPGVGRSTAAAIAAFAFGERAAILDGNVKRVLARHFGVEGQVQQWELATRLLPARGIEAYTQGLMDLGATVCVRRSPRCDACPVARTCWARKHGRVDEMPSPRAKKPLPTKQATWFVVFRYGRVLLRKRPSPGIWGGLWSFPEVDDLRRACREAGANARWARKLAPIEHGFTHFRLRIQPVLCRIERASARAEAAGRMWIDIEEAKGAAVPAPVKALLGTLA